MAAKALLHGTGMVGAIVGALLAGHVALQPVLAQEAPAAPAAADAAAAPAADPAAAPPPTDAAAVDQAAVDASPGDVLTDAEEAELLKAKASLPPEEAHKAALAQYPGGTIVATIFGDENGVVVYEMQLFDAAGARHKVKVDANTGLVVFYPDE